ncbi:MAG: transposase, partial [Luteimonas sp.]
MSKRRKFSAEFKRGAVEQASQPGVSCAQVARELGIRDTLLTPPCVKIVVAPIDSTLGGR